MSNADDMNDFKSTAKELIAASRELINKMDELLKAVETKEASKVPDKKSDTTSRPS